MAIGPAGSKGGCRRTVQKVCLMVCRRHEETFGHVKSPQALPSGVFILGVFIPKGSSRYPRKTLAATFFSVQYVLLLNPVIHPHLHINVPVGRVLLTVSVGHRLASLHPPSRRLLHGHSQRIQYSSANPKLALHRCCCSLPQFCSGRRVNVAVHLMPCLRRRWNYCSHLDHLALIEKIETLSK